MPAQGSGREFRSRERMPVSVTGTMGKFKRKNYDTSSRRGFHSALVHGRQDFKGFLSVMAPLPRPARKRRHRMDCR